MQTAAEDSIPPCHHNASIPVRAGIGICINSLSVIFTIPLNNDLIPHRRHSMISLNKRYKMTAEDITQAIQALC